MRTKKEIKEKIEEYTNRINNFPDFFDYETKRRMEIAYKESIRLLKWVLEEKGETNA